ncbi:hypothetical protein [Shewanella surugensis]|uniref:Uncharacterized protein n=1 Tax=Shewanella surugensis TaxID=212020 RepID=A0ABT0L953_9GAMM|nr:hypothetical protein [Shewanella surugensis]MCL1123681.1 hypothetical protein [Shewanella surugensis]
MPPEVALLRTVPVQSSKVEESSITSVSDFKGRSVTVVGTLDELRALQKASPESKLNPIDTKAFLQALTSQTASNEENVGLQSTSLKDRLVSTTSQVMLDTVKAVKFVANTLSESIDLDAAKHPATLASKQLNSSHTQLKEALGEEMPKPLTQPDTLGNWKLALYKEPEEVQAVQVKVTDYNTKLKELEALKASIKSAKIEGLDDSALQILVGKFNSKIDELKQANTAISEEIKEQFDVLDMHDTLTNLLEATKDQSSAHTKLEASVNTFVQASRTDHITQTRIGLSSFKRNLPETLTAELNNEQLAYAFDIFNGLDTVENKRATVKERLEDAIASRAHKPDIGMLSKMAAHFLKTEFTPEDELTPLLGERKPLDERTPQNDLPFQLAEQLIDVRVNENAEKFIDQVLQKSLSKAQDLNVELAENLTLGDQDTRLLQAGASYVESYSARLLDSDGKLDEVRALEQNQRKLSLQFLTGTIPLDEQQGMGGMPLMGQFYQQNVDVNELGLPAGLSDDLSEFVESEVSLAQDLIQAESDLALAKSDQRNIQLKESLESLIKGKEPSILGEVIRKSPEAYHGMLKGQVDGLVKKELALTALCNKLDVQMQDNLAALFNKELQEVRHELTQSRLMLNVINETRLSIDVKDVGSNNVERLRGLNTELSAVQLTTRQEKARINLALYHTQLPKLRESNAKLLEFTPKLSEHVQLRAELAAEYKVRLGQERFDNTFDANFNLKPVVDGQNRLPQTQINAIQKQNGLINGLQEQVKASDILYTRDLLELKRIHAEIEKSGGFPDQGGYLDSKAWLSWSKQTIAGSWSSEHHPSFQELILERQLAKHGKSSVTEAVTALVMSYSQTTKAPLPGQTQDSTAISSKVKALHAWTQAHPVESMELAKNLSHAYNIITAPGGSFGQDLTGIATTVWSSASLQNQVEELLVGNREVLPNTDQLTMPLEMIGLLYLSSLAPTAVGAVKGVSGAGALATFMGTLTGPLGFGMVATGMIKGLSGAMQTKVESELVSKFSANRKQEVMFSSLNAAFKTQNLTMLERAQIAKDYVASRDAMQAVGNLQVDIKEVGVVGTVQRQLTNMQNWWSHATPSAKVFAASTMAVTGLMAGGAVAAAVVLTIGTGGIAPIVALALGLIVSSSGLYTGSRIVDWAGQFGIMGLADTAEKVKKELTEKRIDEALGKLDIDNAVATIDGFSLAQFKQKHAAAFAKLEETEQVHALKAELKAVFVEKQRKLEQAKRDQDALLVARTQEELQQMGIEAKEKEIRTLLSSVDDIISENQQVELNQMPV